MLALRFDLLPTAYCNELFNLLNNVAPFPYADVRKIIRSELGGEPETIFKLLVCEVARAEGGTRTFVWDAAGDLPLALPES